MKSPEFYSSVSNNKTWIYDTPYDVIRLEGIAQLDNEESAFRMECIENYIDYVNNEMPENYRVALRTYNPLSRYAVTRFDSGYTRVVPLYTQNQSGEFEKICTTNNMRYFLGNKIVVHDNQVYVYDSTRNIAAQPKAGCGKLELINTLLGSMHEDRMMYEDYENTIDRILPKKAD